MTRSSAAHQSTMFDLFDGTAAAPPRPPPVDATPAIAEAAIEADEESMLAEQRVDLGLDAPTAPVAPMAADPGQDEMFSLEEPWREHWRGMPEYSNEDLTARHSVLINFATDADLEAFAKLIGQTVLATTRSVWFPEAEIGHMVGKRYADSTPVIVERARPAAPSAPAKPIVGDPEFNDDIPF